MEFQDHDYTSSAYDKVSQSEFAYRMNSKEIGDFVRLRVSNKHLFSGRRNTSMWAWRAILKYMGLQHKMSHSQASKKWENMKKKYKKLKNPPDGVEVFPEAWPYFRLMDNAMECRLEGSAPVLKALPRYSSDFLTSSKARQRRMEKWRNSMKDSSEGKPEIEVSLNRDENEEEQVFEDEGHQERDCIMRGGVEERNTVHGEQQGMDREKHSMEQERLVLQRERAVLEREMASLDRDRALLERETAALEREKGMLEKEREMMEKDRDAVNRERLIVEREKARLQRLSAKEERSEEAPQEDSSQLNISDVLDRKERFLLLFEKLIENF